MAAVNCKRLGIVVEAKQTPTHPPWVNRAHPPPAKPDNGKPKATTDSA